MIILPDTALTYDDVLLVPQYSEVSSRKKLSTEARLTKKIKLQIPIVSSNMDTVTESAMAIAMAREGGIGIIHRFMTIEQQASEIARVKKAESFIVTDPITLTVNDTVGDARRLVDEPIDDGERDRRVQGVKPPVGQALVVLLDAVVAVPAEVVLGAGWRLGMWVGVHAGGLGFRWYFVGLLLAAAGRGWRGASAGPTCL